MLKILKENRKDIWNDTTSCNVKKQWLYLFDYISDTTMERNTLMAQCYPKIKDYCREKHGLEFQVGLHLIKKKIVWHIETSHLANWYVLIYIVKH